MAKTSKPSIAETHPELAAQADGWDPTTLTAGSNKKVGWKCVNGHVFMAVLCSRTLQKTGCPICSNQQLLVGYNDLATTHPELAAQADGWDPATVTVSSGKKRKWKCALGHTWLLPVDGRRAGTTGCPICSNQQLLVGYNDLATTHPEIAKQAHNWDPTTMSAGSHKKAAWICEKGHIWSSVIHTKVDGIGCPICSNQQLLVGYNDLATTHPQLVSEVDGWQADTVTAGSNKRMLWKCSFGHNWRADVASRTIGRGCPSCALTGFDPNKDGWLYFLQQPDWEMSQIGITNVPDDRLKKHKRLGWELLELRGPMDGHLTQKLETDCLHALEKRGALLGHKAGIEKFDGYSEAWTKKSLNVTSIKQILDWVYEDEAEQ